MELSQTFVTTVCIRRVLQLLDFTDRVLTPAPRFPMGEDGIVLPDAGTRARYEALTRVGHQLSAMNRVAIEAAEGGIWPLPYDVESLTYTRGDAAGLPQLLCRFVERDTSVGVDSPTRFLVMRIAAAKALLDNTRALPESEADLCLLRDELHQLNQLAMSFFVSVSLAYRETCRDGLLVVGVDINRHSPNPIPFDLPYPYPDSEEEES